MAHEELVKLAEPMLAQVGHQLEESGHDKRTWGRGWCVPVSLVAAARTSTEILSAVRVSLERLLTCTRPSPRPPLQVPAASAHPEPSSSYEGGFVHLPGSFPQANLVLAFEYQGGWRDVRGAVIMTVLTYLMGGGNSFSSGGRAGHVWTRCLLSAIVVRRRRCSDEGVCCDKRAARSS